LCDPRQPFARHRPFGSSYRYDNFLHFERSIESAEERKWAFGSAQRRSKLLAIDHVGSALSSRSGMAFVTQHYRIEPHLICARGCLGERALLKSNSTVKHCLPVQLSLTINGYCADFLVFLDLSEIVAIFINCYIRPENSFLRLTGYLKYYQVPYIRDFLAQANGRDLRPAPSLLS
jgi:hypothetical protein